MRASDVKGARRGDADDAAFVAALDALVVDDEPIDDRVRLQLHLLNERARAVAEAIGEVPSAPPIKAPPLPPSPASLLGPSPLGQGAALLQLSCAEGARVRLRALQVEARAQPIRLFDHLSEILQEQLTRHPWYAEPLRVAAERVRELSPMLATRSRGLDSDAPAATPPPLCAASTLGGGGAVAASGATLLSSGGVSKGGGSL